MIKRCLAFTVPFIIALSVVAQAEASTQPPPISIIKSNLIFASHRVPALPPAAPEAKITFVNHDNRAADIVIFEEQRAHRSSQEYRYQGIFRKDVLIEGKISKSYPSLHHRNSAHQSFPTAQLQTIYVHFTDGTSWNAAEF